VVVPLPAFFYERPAVETARNLSEAALPIDSVGGIVVETRAYNHEDPASHIFAGRTIRNGACRNFRVWPVG